MRESLRILLRVAILGCLAIAPARADLLREREPNGSSATAQAVLPDASVGGVISAPGDLDLFAIRLPANGIVQAGLLARGFRDGSSLTGVLKILAGDGTTVLAQDQSQGGTDDPAVSVQVGSAGVYFVSVADAGGLGGTGYWYVLSIELEGNGGFDTATPVDPPAIPAIDSMIWPAADSDFYRFPGQAGQTVTVDLDSAVFNPINPPIKGVLTLYDSSHSVMATDSYTAADPNDPFLAVTLSASGTYYVEVRDARSFVGSPVAFYQLGIRVGPPAPNDSPSSAIPIVAPRAVSGTICPAGDQNEFSFGQSAPGSLSLDVDAVEGLQSLLQGTVAALTATGTVLAGNSGVPDPSLIASLPAGSYLASVGGPSGGLCEDAYYQLWIDGDPESDGLHLPADNCPTVYNPAQADGDGDGVGDACDDCVAVFNPGQESNLRVQDPVGDTLHLTPDPGGTLLQWSPAPGSVASNVYRASRVPGLPPNFGCLFDNVAGGTAVESGGLPPGSVCFYAVSGENCGESGLGDDSSGQPRTFAPCPNPI